ncbi:MAG: molybdopterin-guanine dinucleotide biosynthesis protein B [Methanoregulaceae archaeon]|jgi:molybdopterin synthase catalytic subunit|nr:molybdopterin-guanine dinucleotide biosynthesis protein B [Methanoregulaceae archaeon]MCU0628331.1 molybdopterin-guanine dinucleotide biosynthesis protein B [Methanoregulaceae archaeon]
MKVIHITGFSNTGKTTFITELLPELERLGPVGVIKHIGHHGYALPEGKDTTRFFAAGADASAGIDAGKSVLLLQENDLERILILFCDAGIQYAVVEGFKEKPYPKIVIGTVPGAEHVILVDPSVKDVLAHLNEFSDLITPEGLLKEIQRDCTHGMTTLVSTITINGNSPKEKITDLRAELDEKIRDLGEVFARIEYSGNTKAGIPLKLIIGICAPDPLLAIGASLVATELLLPFITGGEE